MSEYRYVLSLYKEYKDYPKKIIIFSAVMILLASILTGLNLVRISPLLYYGVALAITLFYASRNHVESENFLNLKKFVAKYYPKLLDNEERLFFIDYQLRAYFDKESTELFDHLNDNVQWNDTKAIANLKLIISKIEEYYNYLTDNSELDQNIEISLEVYDKSFENKKKDLV